MATKQIPINSLFEAAGLSKTGLVSLNENTYDFDPMQPKNSWLYGILIAFQKLKYEGYSPLSYGAIGAGSGVDSIGAKEVFGLKKIFQTDIHPNVIDIAQQNAVKHVGLSTQVKTFLGDLCAPLLAKNICVDLLCANIPNIPSEKPVWHKKVSSSRFYKKNYEKAPKIFETWYLSLQYQFLKQAKAALSSNGIVMVAIGARVPCEVMQKLFSETGYTASELINIYRLQTEPEEVIAGYAEQEIHEGIVFDFYDHTLALPVWQKECEGKDLSSEEIKDKLSPFRMSAFESLRMYKKHGRQIGHIYSIFKLTK